MDIQPTAALLVIDMQNDFLPGGSLAVEHADELIPLINKLGTLFQNVVLTQDWHPPMHISFASTHKKRPFVETVEAAYGTQSLWPDHTVQGSSGAALHPALDPHHAGLVLRKGFRREIDSYSAFLENDHRTGTGLAGYLYERKISHLYLCGVASDFCVGYTALDGAALGFEMFVIQDAVRGIAPDTIAAMNLRCKQAGIRNIESKNLLY